LSLVSVIKPIAPLGVLTISNAFILLVLCGKYNVYTLPIQKRSFKRRFWGLAKWFKRGYFGNWDMHFGAIYNS